MLSGLTGQPFPATMPCLPLLRPTQDGWWQASRGVSRGSRHHAESRWHVRALGKLGRPRRRPLSVRGYRAKKGVGISYPRSNPVALRAALHDLFAVLRDGSTALLLMFAKA